jgi:acetyltransferase-like isoleucine patch superfamily enzyme
MLLKLICVLLPWKLKRFILQKRFGYTIDSSAYIGLSWVYPGKLVMEKNSRIDHFTVAIHLDLMQIGEDSSIGRSNWITGLSSKTETPFFKHQTNRLAHLIIGNHSHITKKHHLDCTNLLQIGNFVTIAGYDSQFLTHSIDPFENRQHSEPIVINDYSFVGTNVVVLGGSVLPPRSILGAKSLLNKKYEEEFKLYAGVPAKPVSDLDKNSKYFYRDSGIVY